jgi:hypothetical protein
MEALCPRYVGGRAQKGITSDYAIAGQKNGESILLFLLLTCKKFNPYMLLPEDKTGQSTKHRTKNMVENKTKNSNDHI